MSARVTLHRLRQRLLDQFAQGCDAALDDAAFDRLALDVFAIQFELNSPYRAYCLRRGRTPEAVEAAADVPAVPTDAFRELRLVTAAGDGDGDAAGPAEVIFRTSGTTRGHERRGEHVVPDLALYRSSLLPMFSHYVVPEGRGMDMLSLVPRHAARPDSSLSCMVDTVIQELGGADSEWFVSADGGLEVQGMLDALRTAEAGGRPIVLLGTSLAFTHLLDAMAAGGTRVRLPEASRLMDTGGSKGARRQVQPEELARRYEAALGIARAWQVNEYGMTELCSQFYDGRLRASALGRPAAPSDERKTPPPWLRSTAVDPATLQPLPKGAVGILRHHDLANLGSVAAVQTEDLGRVHRDGTVELLGRMPGAQPRGCSIAMDLMLGGADAD